MHTAGACDFRGGTIDAAVDTIVAGKTSSGSGAGNPVGTLSMDAGKLSVDTFQLGYQSAAGANFGQGIANVYGGLLAVNSVLELGHISGGTGTNNTSGTLNIQGGTVCVADVVAGQGGGTNRIIVNNGTLIVTNSVGNVDAPIGSVALTNSTLMFTVQAGRTNLCAERLVTGVGANLIRIASLPVPQVLPVVYPLIQFSGAVAGAGNNFMLDGLPTEANYTAYLAEDAAARCINLVITNRPAPGSMRIASLQIASGQVIMSGTGGEPGTSYYVLASTNVALPLAYWARVATNNFDPVGQFVISNLLDTGHLPQFFRLQAE